MVTVKHAPPEVQGRNLPFFFFGSGLVVADPQALPPPLHGQLCLCLHIVFLLCVFIFMSLSPDKDSSHLGTRTHSTILSLHLNELQL